MVNRIELAPVDHVLDVRRFDDDDALVLEERCQPTQNTVEIGDVREHVVSVDDIGPVVVPAEARGKLFAEELGQRWNAPLALGYFGNVGCWLDAQHRHSRSLVVLQKITVVAGDFYDETLVAELTRRDESTDKPLGVAQHRVGEG